MKAIKYIFSALVGMVALASCDSNITDFEYQGYTGAPKTIDASAVTSEALPGAIRLNWTVPADSTFSYMKISYVNPANQETVTNVVSIHTRTLLIENTLKKYGDYTFTFQAFNDKNEAGAPMQVKAQSVLNIPITDAYEKAVELIVEQIHRKKGKLVTTGMGKAGQIAMNIATTFCSTGIPAVFLHPSEAQHGDLGILQENDLLLLISNSGKTREIVELTQLAHNLNPNLKYIVITGNADSPLARESDICLCTGHPDEVCALGMTPTTSTTVMTVIGDILVVETMKRTGFTIEEYSKRHHGGYLGERSRELSK